MRKEIFMKIILVILIMIAAIVLPILAYYAVSFKIPEILMNVQQMLGG